MSRDDGALAHAWAYFELHATQRITIFNYFVVFSCILATGLAAAIQAPPRLSSVGVALGILLALLSYLFWQLDRRTAFLVKHAEDAIKQQEPAGAQLINDEVDKTRDAKENEGLWTYGKVFRSIFIVMAMVGIAGAFVSGLRWAGYLAWDEPKLQQYIAGPLGTDLPPTTGTETQTNDRAERHPRDGSNAGKVENMGLAALPKIDGPAPLKPTPTRKD